MKILLIGGTGILSTDIAKLAIKTGHDVTALNRGTRLRRMVAGVRHIQADIRNADHIKDVLGKESFDVVVDFLSFNPAQLSQTFSSLESRCGQYVFISSATVYKGKARGEIKTEESPIFNDSWTYPLDKSRCEKLLQEACANRTVNFTIVRPYITYGETRIPFGLIARPKQWTIIHRIRSRKPVVLWDGGEAICTLTHTTDFAKAMVGLWGNKQALNEIFHITSGETFTWREVLEQIAEIVGEAPVIASIPSTSIAKALPEEKGRLLGDRARDNIFDNTKIREAVPEFSCTTNLRTGLQTTLDYYKTHEEMMGVDYRWDGLMDRLILRCCPDLANSSSASLNLGYIRIPGSSLRDHADYISSRHPVVGNAGRIFRLVKWLLRKTKKAQNIFAPLKGTSRHKKDHDQ